DRPFLELRRISSAHNSIIPYLGEIRNKIQSISDRQGSDTMDNQMEARVERVCLSPFADRWPDGEEQ
ncbi:MAG: hypothetical protein L0L47_06710, partial [Bifidobacterium mongoliense]|nr:hypothetical protein [Bifidobacterium mongoliense]